MGAGYRRSKNSCARAVCLRVLAPASCSPRGAVCRCRPLLLVPARFGWLLLASLLLSLLRCGSLRSARLARFASLGSPRWPLCSARCSCSARCALSRGRFSSLASAGAASRPAPSSRQATRSARRSCGGVKFYLSPALRSKRADVHRSTSSRAPAPRARAAVKVASKSQIPLIFLLKFASRFFGFFEWGQNISDRLAFVEILNTTSNFSKSTVELYKIFKIDSSEIIQLDDYFLEYFIRLLKRLRDINFEDVQKQKNLII